MPPTFPSTTSPLKPIPTPQVVHPKGFRWWQIGVALVLFLLPIALTLEMVLLKRAGLRSPANRKEIDDAGKSASPASKEKAHEGSERERPSGSETKDDPGSAPPTPSVDPLLDVVGGMTSAQLFQSYLNIGFLADGVEGELYTSKYAGELLARVVSTLKVVDEHLERVPRGRLDVNERKRLARGREVNKLLRAQARELQLYWETEKQEHVDRFQKIRAESWAGLEALQEKE